MAAPYRTTIYENLFMMRLSIHFNETPVTVELFNKTPVTVELFNKPPVTVERPRVRERLTWRPHSSSPDVRLAVESCAS